MRRNRSHGWVRRLVAESRVDPSDFIWPVFVQDGAPGRQPIAAMPGVDRLSIEALVEAAGEAAELGVPAIALFPFVPPELKTADGISCSRRLRPPSSPRWRHAVPRTPRTFASSSPTVPCTRFPPGTRRR
jgi:delta-aminolevulinic acid dehydratase/porphobilinogen synthase